MRLFIGIAPDDAVRDALAESAARMRRAASGRYADASLYHLTLAFLGDVGEDSLPVIQRAVMMAVRGMAPFDLVLAEAGLFDTILWRGVAASPALDALADQLRAALDTSGIYYDARPFRPHFTLGRDLKAGQRALDTPLPDGQFTARAVTLYESTRVKGNLTYVPLWEVAL